MENPKRIDTIQTLSVPRVKSIALSSICKRLIESITTLWKDEYMSHI